MRRLFADAKIESVLIDIGYPTMKLSGYDVAPKIFSSMLPVPVKVIVRIEPIIMEIEEKKLPFGEFVDEFVSSVEKKIEQIAYGCLEDGRRVFYRPGDTAFLPC